MRPISLPSDTRRGLGLMFLAQLMLIFVGILFAFSLGGALVVLAFIAVAGLSGMAVYFLWQGRDEFGGRRRRGIRLATGLVLLALVAMVAFWLSASTTVLETNRIDDLRTPLYVLPVLIVAEAAALGLVTWRLADTRERWLLGLFGASALVASPIIILRGTEFVNDLTLRFGREVSPGAAQDAVDLFGDFVKPMLAAYLLVSRSLLAYSLYHMLGRLTSEEHRLAGEDSSRAFDNQ